MNEQLAFLGAGIIVGWIGKQIVSLWKRNKEGITATLDVVDDKIAAKLGIDLGEGFQQTWHSIVHGAVQYVDKFASDGRFWREVIRAIIAKDPSKAVLLSEELRGITWEKGIAAVEATLSPELKQVVNDVKETLAVKVARANVESTGVAPEIAREPEKVEAEIRAAIRVVAPAHKPNEGPVDKDMIDRLLRESLERQRKLSEVRK